MPDHISKLTGHSAIVDFIREGEIPSSSIICSDGTIMSLKIWAGTSNGGQKIINLDRLYVPGSAYRKGLALVALREALKNRSIREQVEIRFVAVYNSNLIRRLLKACVLESEPGTSQSYFRWSPFKRFDMS